MNIKVWEEFLPTFFLERVERMFRIKGKLQFIAIDQSYLKKLHETCSEIYYKSSGYEKKPYIGILINNNNRKYVIPLSSAKEKHKTWKNVSNDCFLVYEYADRSKMRKKDIWIQENGTERVKHILSVVDIKKMIPIEEGLYSIVELNSNDLDTREMKKYKDLLNKEYAFYLKIIDAVIDKANKLYFKQISTGKVAKFCCDFKALERVCDTYDF